MLTSMATLDAATARNASSNTSVKLVFGRKLNFLGRSGWARESNRRERAASFHRSKYWRQRASTSSVSQCFALRSTLNSPRYHAAEKKVPGIHGREVAHPVFAPGNEIDFEPEFDWQLRELGLRVTDPADVGFEVGLLHVPVGVAVGQRRVVRAADFVEAALDGDPGVIDGSARCHRSTRCACGNRSPWRAKCNGSAPGARLEAHRSAAERPGIATSPDLSCGPGFGTLERDEETGTLDGSVLAGILVSVSAVYWYDDQFGSARAVSTPGYH